MPVHFLLLKTNLSLSVYLYGWSPKTGPSHRVPREYNPEFEDIQLSAHNRQGALKASLLSGKGILFLRMGRDSEGGRNFVKLHVTSLIFNVP